MNDEEKQLYNLLKSIKFPIRKSYSRAEVCSILGISNRKFFYLIATAGQGKNGRALDSYIKQHERRVSFSELAVYMERNNTFLVKNGL